VAFRCSGSPAGVISCGSPNVWSRGTPGIVFYQLTDGALPNKELLQSRVDRWVRFACWRTGRAAEFQIVRVHGEAGRGWDHRS
jgi:hypothetical protein